MTVGCLSRAFARSLLHLPNLSPPSKQNPAPLNPLQPTTPKQTPLTPPHPQNKRHWLKGPKAGTTDAFATNLPGAPDGVCRSADGGYWVSIQKAYPAATKYAASRLVRVAMGWAPLALRPQAPQRGLVLKLSPEGALEYSLGDPDGSVVRGITSAVESPDGWLWLGSLQAEGAAGVDLVGALRGRVGAGVEAAAKLLRELEARRAAAAAEEAVAARAGGVGEGGAPLVEEDGDGGPALAANSDRSEL